jgi:hypothetical protein
MKKQNYPSLNQKRTNDAVKEFYVPAFEKFELETREAMKHVLNMLQILKEENSTLKSEILHLKFELDKVRFEVKNIFTQKIQTRFAPIDGQVMMKTKSKKKAGKK